MSLNNDNKLIIESLAWDSTFFGYPVFRIKGYEKDQLKIKEIIAKLAEQKVKLAYWFSPQEISIPQELAAELVDIKVDYTIPVTGPGKDDNEVKVYPASLPALPLYELALVSGAYSRFRVDRQFKNNEFEKLYKEWLTKSVSRELADEVFVIEENGIIQAFVTTKFDKESATERIGLIAVKEGNRGKNLGGRLVEKVKLHAFNNGATRLNVATQEANVGACRFYTKCGFTPFEKVFIYHIWIYS